MSARMPVGVFGPGLSSVYELLMIGIWLIVLAFATAALARFFLRERLAGLRRPEALFALAIAGVVVIWAMSQVNRNVYEAAHILPMSVLYVVLCLTLPAAEGPLLRRWLTLFVIAMVPIAGLAQAVVLGRTTRPMLQALAPSGYPDQQPFSVSIADYGRIRQDIDRAMRQAGLPTDRRLHRLMIDDLTYLALQDSLLPLHRLGVLSTWNGSIADPVGYR